MILPKIYPIADPFISGKPLQEQAKQFLDVGARFFQLRAKEMSSEEFFAEAKEVSGMAAPFGARVIINDRVDIALSVGAAGVHLGQYDLPRQYARRLMGKTAIIGYSTHSVEQAIEAIRLPIDYIAIGPIFETDTKFNTYDAVGLRGVEMVRAAIGDFPLVAIGGINIENFESVLAAGANSAAMISGFWCHDGGIDQTYKGLLSGS